MAPAAAADVEAPVADGDSPSADSDAPSAPPADDSAADTSAAVEENGQNEKIEEKVDFRMPLPLSSSSLCEFIAQMKADSM